LARRIVGGEASMAKAIIGFRSNQEHLVKDERTNAKVARDIQKY